MVLSDQNLTPGFGHFEHVNILITLILTNGIWRKKKWRQFPSRSTICERLLGPGIAVVQTRQVMCDETTGRVRYYLCQIV